MNAQERSLRRVLFVCLCDIEKPIIPLKKRKPLAKAKDPIIIPEAKWKVDSRKRNGVIYTAQLVHHRLYSYRK